IHPDGWIVTNNHVIWRAAVDPATLALRVNVYFGRMGKDGWMELIDEPIPAAVYKTDPARDLALLKVMRKPAGLDRLPVVPLAKQGPGPAADCVALGHPKAGALWTVRSGEVARVAHFPHDDMDNVIKRLALASSPNAQMMRRTLGQM